MLSFQFCPVQFALYFKLPYIVSSYKIGSIESVKDPISSGIRSRLLLIFCSQAVMLITLAKRPDIFPRPCVSI